MRGSKARVSGRVVPGVYRCAGLPLLLPLFADSTIGGVTLFVAELVLVTQLESFSYIRVFRFDSIRLPSGLARRLGNIELRPKIESLGRHTVFVFGVA